MIRTVISGLFILLAACSTAPSYNPSVFPYEIDEERLAAAPIKTVVIAHVNLGDPTRNYLRVHEARIDKMVEAYLEENGITVLPTRLFEQEWKRAVRAYGDVYDPTTGEVNRKSFALALVNVRDALRETHDLDAFVFTDILSQKVAFSAGINHIARFNGVSRKPTLQGPGEGVSTAFDWSREADSASLWVSVYDMELQRVFTSIGGLDMTEAIDTRSSSGAFVRRRSILENKTNIREGIELAFHPFIPMERYPGKPES